MANYFFRPGEFPPVPTRSEAVNDDFLFNQGPTRGLGKVQFHDYSLAYGLYGLPNIGVFKEQIETLKTFLAAATPDEAQQKDTDFLLALGELFTLVVYGQLILENARLYEVNDNVVDQIFDFMVRDFSKYALQLYGKPSTTSRQMELCLKMIRKPVADTTRFGRVWQEWVYPLRDAYEMNP